MFPSPDGKKKKNDNNNRLKMCRVRFENIYIFVDCLKTELNLGWTETQNATCQELLKNINDLLRDR